MNIRWTHGAIALFAFVDLGSALAAAAHESRERVPIDWKRAVRAAQRRGVAPAPPIPELPPELTIARAGTALHVVPGPAGRRPGLVFESQALAIRAGEEMAREAMRVWGWHEYWRAGFARGISAALDDPRVGVWDRGEGMRAGRSDPRVRPLGDHFANESAVGPAGSVAEGRVREQFMDLSREPGRERAGGMAQRSLVPHFDGPYATDPVLGDVFLDYPIARTAGLSRDGYRAINEWRVEPTLFARGDRLIRAYDPQWKDSGFAFSTWRRRQGHGSAWARWASVDRERFRALFCERFDATLDSIDRRFTLDAWRIGFEDGWRYGASIAAEWAYRRGYAEAFDAGVSETASIAYPYAFARAYDAAYDQWFNEWSRTVHPGIGELHVSDETNDGIFEPGERVVVDVDVVNYGGGDGAVDLIASGSELGAPARANVQLRGRGRVPRVDRLELRINDRVRPRTRTEVTATLGDARTDATLYVSRPMEFAGPPAIDADRIGGRATLTLAVSNTSRRDARAVVRVERSSDPRDPREVDLGVIPAGGRSSATVTFNGIHPLELIGSESRWRAAVARGGTTDDVRDVRLPPVAVDLSNPDLMDFMVALARAENVSRSDVQDARALLMERLRADWDRAADSSGNPYKRDFESAGADTVLGELVRITLVGRQSFASPQVFSGLDGAVAALSDDLPGAHPLLRKWMKKLAARLW